MSSRLVPLYIIETMVKQVADEDERVAVHRELCRRLVDGYGFVRLGQLHGFSEAARKLLLSYMAGRSNLIGLCTADAYVEV